MDLRGTEVDVKCILFALMTYKATFTSASFDTTAGNGVSFQTHGRMDR